MNERPAGAVVRGAPGPPAYPHRSILVQAGMVLAGSTPLTLTNDKAARSFSVQPLHHGFQPRNDSTLAHVGQAHHRLDPALRA